MHRQSKPQHFPGKRHIEGIELVLGHSWRELKCVAIAFSLWFSSEWNYYYHHQKSHHHHIWRSNSTSAVPNADPSVARSILAWNIELDLDWWSEPRRKKARDSKYLIRERERKKNLLASLFSLDVSHLFSEGATQCRRSFTLRDPLTNSFTFIYMYVGWINNAVWPGMWSWAVYSLVSGYLPPFWGVRWGWGFFFM